MSIENHQHKSDSLIKSVSLSVSRIGSIAFAGITIASSIEGWWASGYEVSTGITSGVFLVASVALATHGGDENARSWRRLKGGKLVDPEAAARTRANDIDLTPYLVEESEITVIESAPVEPLPSVDIPA